MSGSRLDTLSENWPDAIRVRTSAHSSVRMKTVVSPGHVSVDMMVSNLGKSTHTIVSKAEAREMGNWLLRYADGAFDDSIGEGASQ